jgi:hypothetical protein
MHLAALHLSSPLFHPLAIVSNSRYGQNPSPLLASLAKGETMKSKFRSFVVAVLAALALPAAAHASCGDIKGALFQRQSWNGSTNHPSLVFVSDDAAAIVGMWHVTFTAKGNEVGPPDGAPIDNALVTWHADGTETMNSGRPAQDGQICMGVWQRTGPLAYTLNHFAWAGNDTANAPYGIGNPSGPTRFYEKVTLSADGKTYNGTFTLDAYDINGTVAAHIVGTVHGTRITINTTVPDIY